MNLQQLYYFREIAELNHYSAAASKMHVSQSSLSHSIIDLEKELGVELFVRHGRNVHLTGAGELFLRYVNNCLRELEEGTDRVHDYIGVDTGVIGIGYLSSLARYVPRIISRFFATTGKLQNRFQFDQSTTRDIEQHLLRGSIDVAFTTPFEDNKEIASHKIGTHKTVLVVSASHPLAAQTQVDLRDLKDETFIAYDESCQIRSYINDIFREVGYEPRISFTSQHDSIMLGAVSAGLGIALMPESSDSPDYNIRCLDILNDIPTREIHIAWVRDRYMSPAVKNFLHFVLESGMLLDDIK